MTKWLAVLFFASAVALGEETPTSAPSDPGDGTQVEVAKQQTPLSPEELPEPEFLKQLAKKVVATYMALEYLTFESRVFEKTRGLVNGQAKLEFQKDAPLIATIKTQVTATGQLRSEARAKGKLVWGMVVGTEQNGKLPGVQWNTTSQTKPYVVKPGVRGRHFYCDGDAPGHCILGWSALPLVGGSRTKKDTVPTLLWESRIAAGKYKGLVANVAGEKCYLVSTALGGGQIVHQYYIHPRTFLVTQIDKLQTTRSMTGKVIGTASQRWTFENIRTTRIDYKSFALPSAEDRALVDAGTPFTERR